MSLLEKIKADQLEARKLKQSMKAAALTTLFAEAQAIGKDKGRDTTDEEVIAVIKKFIANVDLCVNGYLDNSIEEPGSPEFQNRLADFAAEKIIYQSYLPKQLSAQELEDIIIGQFPEKTSLGQIMGYLKNNYAGKYDGKLASSVANGLY